MTKPNKEQRKHQRIYRNFILSYHPVSDPSKKMDVSQINNISQGGVNFSVSQPVLNQEILMMDLKTPFLGDHLALQGIVLECREKVSGLIYEVRVQFQNLPIASKEILAKIEKYTLKEK